MPNFLFQTLQKLSTQLSILCMSFLFANAASAADNKLMHSQIATGSGSIERVELVDPTQRYDHFVLGDRFEAAGFQVHYTAGATDIYRLPHNQVFEDRVPRLFDLTGDGREELVLVVSQIDKGASLAIFDLAPDGIALLAQTPFIGQPYRWLNPAGIADFDGDGQFEIALVSKPHLAKELQLWRCEQGGLKLVSKHAGFSNHRLGSREQRLSALVDLDGDSILDLIVPSANRTALHFLSFANGFRELNRVDLRAEIAGPLSIAADGLNVPLRDGSVQKIRLQTD